MRMPQSPPSSEDLLAELQRPEDFNRVLVATKPLDDRDRYLHWDDMRNRTPPAGLTQHEWWLGTSLARRALSRELPLRSAEGAPFQFCNVDLVQEMVHRIDQQASGQILAEDVVTNLRSSSHYLVSSLAEEAITSSQLEGASTTRAVAKELLATGRRPRDRSEQMIVNNFNAMVFAQELEGDDLLPRDVLDLHRIVTENTLDNPQDAGRLQNAGDERVAVYWHDGTVLHQPPNAAELPERLDAMCRFANGELGDGFIHPVVRAILVHFWLAYDHPFVDGNGRTARALFYWTMLHNRYWLTQYLSVSSILQKAPSKYVRSYLLAETGELDVTYFVLYQLQVIQRAIESLHDYLGRKIAATREIERLLHGSPHLNKRQLLVVRDALRDAGEPFTIAAQARRHRVTYQSARTDLLGLEALGLLSKRAVGKKHIFRAMPDIAERLQDLGRT